MGKINVAELIKDCPNGMELDCTMYDNLYFDSLNADYYGTINCYTLIDGIKTSINFTKYGTFNNHTGAKCVIFPKGKTTWEGFKRPFKDGDILTTNIGSIFIFSHLELDRISDRNICKAYVGIRDTMPISLFHTEQSDIFGPYESMCELATEEEKSKLFDAIKSNGYKWVPETKTLDKLIEPKFKVGDRIRNKNDKTIHTINYIYNDSYGLCDGHILFFKEQDQYELVPNKFDINTLKPFDKVLVRGDVGQKWTHDFFGFIDKDKGYPFVCVGHYVIQCIPYEGNEHLIGKVDDCDEYFKIWKN